jgi:1-deoxy-D-xylulose-5-phosphate reductoisomerase
MSPTGISILGATGSIGASTLDVLARNPERYHLYAVSAHSRMDRLAEIIRTHRPEHAVVSDEAAADKLAALLKESGARCSISWGSEALSEMASADEVEVVMAAIVGAAALAPTLAAARSGKRILLANKEALVMSGSLLLEAVREGGAELLPVDSEHNAIFQCLPAGFDYGLGRGNIIKLLLTASGGPFRTLAADRFGAITPEMAVAHPNWVMGRKISVDSATMMNKGLEVIEAHWLFGVDAERIEVVIHPQSMIHSMVQYVDGSVIAQMGNPDMRTPIAHALAWPERIRSGVEPLDFSRLAGLSFEAPDPVRFPCLRLAYQALKAAGTAPAILNAANEVAVAAFLAGRLSFAAIARLVEETLEAIAAVPASGLDTVLGADSEARSVANALLARAESLR